VKSRQCTSFEFHKKYTKNTLWCPHKQFAAGASYLTLLSSTHAESQVTLRSSNLNVIPRRSLLNDIFRARVLFHSFLEASLVIVSWKTCLSVVLCLLACFQNCCLKPQSTTRSQAIRTAAAPVLIPHFIASHVNLTKYKSTYSDTTIKNVLPSQQPRHRSAHPPTRHRRAQARHQKHHTHTRAQRQLRITSLSKHRHRRALRPPCGTYKRQGHLQGVLHSGRHGGAGEEGGEQGGRVGGGVGWGGVVEVYTRMRGVVGVAECKA